MTYCLAIRLNDGIVFASDSRTNAGVDHVSCYSKMHTFSTKPDRFFVLLSAGNLATSQGVVNALQRDIDNTKAECSLNNVEHVFDAAHYVGALNQRVQIEHHEALAKSRISPEASFILGGQLRGQPHEIYLIYPQGNYICASPSTPFLQIGETKYGKPILDRIISPTVSLADGARCALVSLDSTIRSNISVGPPIELSVYKTNEYALAQRLIFDTDSTFFAQTQQCWGDGLRQVFNTLPRFDWET